MAKSTDRLGELQTRLTDVKLAGRRVSYPLSEAVGSYAYEFRSNEQAAAVAVEQVVEWLEERRPEVLRVDWDDSALVEALVEILRGAESEWRNEPETREEYGQGQRFVYIAERVVEELRARSA